MASKKASETSKREVLTPIIVVHALVPGGGGSCWLASGCVCVCVVEVSWLLTF